MSARTAASRTKVVVVVVEGVGGGGKSVGMRYGHTDLCMTNSPGVCFPSQPSASVSTCVPPTLLGVTETCDPSKCDASVLLLLQGKNVLEEKMDTRAVR